MERVWKAALRQTRLMGMPEAAELYLAASPVLLFVLRRL
jgi:hypothetical protein